MNFIASVHSKKNGETIYELVSGNYKCLKSGSELIPLLDAQQKHGNQYFVVVNAELVHEGEGYSIKLIDNNKDSLDIRESYIKKLKGFGLEQYIYRLLSTDKLKDLYNYIAKDTKSIEEKIDNIESNIKKTCDSLNSEIINKLKYELESIEDEIKSKDETSKLTFVMDNKAIIKCTYRKIDYNRLISKLNNAFSLLKKECTNNKNLQKMLIKDKLMKIGKIYSIRLQCIHDQSISDYSNIIENFIIHNKDYIEKYAYDLYSNRSREYDRKFWSSFFNTFDNDSDAIFNEINNYIIDNNKQDLMTYDEILNLIDEAKNSESTNSNKISFKYKTTWQFSHIFDNKKNYKRYEYYMDFYTLDNSRYTVIQMSNYVSYKDSIAGNSYLSSISSVLIKKLDNNKYNYYSFLYIPDSKKYRNNDTSLELNNKCLCNILDTLLYGIENNYIRAANKKLISALRFFDHNDREIAEILKKYDKIIREIQEK